LRVRASKSNSVMPSDNVDSRVGLIALSDNGEPASC